METVDKDFQGASEIGKIFNSFLDKKLLCDFFIDSALTFINATQGYLYLAGTGNQLWVESGTQSEPPEDLKKKAETVFHKGQPLSEGPQLLIPLIVRNNAIGIACFLKQDPQQSFSGKEFSLALDLTYQLAGALQNILLFEKSLKMERLAAVGQTTSMVMHELTNILQLAKLAEESLRRGIETTNQKYLDRGLSGLRKALKEMDGFAYEMLSLTKDYKIKPVPMDVDELLKELQTDLHDKAAQARVSLDFKVEGPKLVVDGEPRSLYRAILNMVKNAIEAADKENAYIHIRGQGKNDESYEIVIEDNGQGMPDEVKAQVFQAFFSTKGERGTGLGLMIIEKTIKAHQGTVQVRSERGKGTTFTLTLPRKISV